MPFDNCQFTGLDMGAPDTTVMGIVTLAAPNVSPGAMKIPNQFTVFLNMAAPAHNLATMSPASIGPPGVGVASGMCMGPGRALMGSTMSFICGAPVTKMGSPAQHNGMSPNAMGARIAPSQVKKMTLR